MSKWITDRRPTYEDAKTGYRHYVWVTGENGIVLQMAYEIVRDRPWMPITPPEPYVKPKRWRVSRFGDEFTAYDSVQREHVTPFLPTREAAERIVEIYNEVMP